MEPRSAGTETDSALVARSPPMLEVLDRARRVAGSKASVLIEGETGTGKEVLARLIHAGSPRAERPFVRVNCAALSESLVESELFGHEKGAFTGADEARPGRFERADGGTLLLDEVSEMPPRLQAKLLRALEEEEFERVGGSQTLQVDVRAVATSNRRLDRELAHGTFRHDLYYRLNAVHLRVPPLRERREDISVLAEHFLIRFRGESRGTIRGISQRASDLLVAYSWPGNVRQLRNALHHACLLATGPEILPQHLPPLEDLSATSDTQSTGTLAEMERHLILRTLRAVGGNKTAAAQRLGVTARTLLNKLKQYTRLDAA